jgi:hypothetical protein
MNLYDIVVPPCTDAVAEPPCDGIRRIHLVEGSHDEFDRRFEAARLDVGRLGQDAMQIADDRRVCLGSPAGTAGVVGLLSRAAFRQRGSTMPGEPCWHRWRGGTAFPRRSTSAAALSTQTATPPTTPSTHWDAAATLRHGRRRRRPMFRSMEPSVPGAVGHLATANQGGRH